MERSASSLGYRFPPPRANRGRRGRARPGRQILPILLASLALAGARETLASPQAAATVCPSLILIGEIDPPLTDTERRLVCGDPKGGAWQVIPFNQARFGLANFLQDRGYLHPRYSSEGGRNFVNIGAPTRVSSLRAEGAPPQLRIQRMRKVLGEPLTPRLLDTVEQWVTQRLEAHGHPCPVVRAEADSETGAVVVKVEPGPRQELVSVIEEPIPGAESGILRRYDAFRLGQLYDGDLLTITENRVVQQNLLQNTHFSVSCGPNGAVARQEVTAGPPRLLTLGFGANTEGYLLGKVEWRNARLGRMGSYLDVTALASAREQNIYAYMNWYFLPHPTRLYARPLVQTRHSNEQYYEYFNTRAQFAGVTTWDNRPLGAIFSLGPTLDYYRTLSGSGSGNPNSHFLSLETELKVRTHEYERYQGDPRTGAMGDLLADFNASSLYSTASAQRLWLRGEALLNYRDYDPPLLIFAWRTGLSTTLSEQRPGTFSLLPPAFFDFLGGSNDLRGFGRQELPLNGLGGMSSVFGSFETRFSSLLPLSLEPIAFVDVGAIGGAPWSLDAPVYWSPGIGLRWHSPVGVIRTTLAHGYPNSVPGHFQFYLSYGEEF